MSVRVTVHPIGSNVLLTDVDAAKKDEWNRRRKIRIKQVREQSKDAATRIRQSINTEKENRQMAENKLHDALLREWQLKKIESLERQYKQCLEEVKLAQQRALQEKEMEALMKERRERLAKLAETRGKKAMETVRKETLDHELEKTKAEKAKHFKKTVEDLRSSLVSTLPHPKRLSRPTPKKKLEKPSSRRPSSNKENEVFMSSSRGVFDVKSKTHTEKRQSSPAKKKRVIHGQKDAEVGSISSRKTWPPATTIPLKRTAKGSPSKQLRRVIHSFDRECTNEAPAPAPNFNLAQNKRQQVNMAAKTLKDSVQRVLPDTDMNDDFGHLVKNLSSLAEQEKFLRNQLLSQVQRCVHPEGESKTAPRPTTGPENFIHSVSHIMDQTLIDDAQPERSDNQSVVIESTAAKKSDPVKKTTDGGNLPSKPGLAEKKQSKAEDIFCDACRKYLKHACAEHSTTVTESVSNSSSLTYMSVSKSTIESNNSSSTTVEGVKVVVSVHGQKNLVKSVKIGKPIHLRKKKKPRKSEKSKSTKLAKVDSRSGSVTSYLSPPERVHAENGEMIKRILQELYKGRKGVDFEECVRRCVAKYRDETRVRTPDSSEASKNSDKQLSRSLQRDLSMKHVSLSDDSELSEVDRESCKKVDKTCQTLTICDKRIQTSKSLDPFESIQREAGDKISKSPERCIPNNANIAETEKLIDYYCNVADKYTDCINHIIGILNRSGNLTQESMDSSLTSHRSPPCAFNESIHLSESMKQLALSTKLPSKPTSPVKSSSPKDTAILRKLVESLQKSPQREKMSPVKPKSPDKKSAAQHQHKFLSSSFFDEDGNLINQAAVHQMLESTSSSVDRERPFGNFTLDISSLTSEEDSGADVGHSSIDSNERSLFRQQQSHTDLIQQQKFINNRVVAVPQDLSTIIEVDTPSTTHQTASLIHDALGLSASKKQLQKSCDTRARHIIEKNKALLQTRIESLQQQIEILNQSQKSQSADTSQELKLSPNNSKKSDKTISAGPKSSGFRRKSDGGSPNGHNTSTDSELPDIVDELIKRGLISSPFPWMKDLKEKFGKDESTQSRKCTTSTESDSTQLINEELGNILRNDLSPADLEDVLKNLGSSWAVSTWKKIAETSRFNSLSSSDSSPAGVKKPDPSDSRSHTKNTPPKHSTPIKHKKRHRSTQVSTSSNDISPEVLFPLDLNCGISSVNNSTSDNYDLTPPDVALHRPQLFRKDNISDR